MQVIAIGRARRQLFNQDEAGRGSTSPCVQRAAVSYRIVDERWLDGAKDVARDAGSSVYDREEVRKELAFDLENTIPSLYASMGSVPNNSTNSTGALPVDLI
jgi:hypothetical protein